MHRPFNSPLNSTVCDAVYEAQEDHPGLVGGISTPRQVYSFLSPIPPATTAGWSVPTWVLCSCVIRLHEERARCSPRAPWRIQSMCLNGAQEPILTHVWRILATLGEAALAQIPDPGLELALTCSHPPIAHLVGVVMGERCDRCPQGPWPWLTGGKWQGEVV